VVQIGESGCALPPEQHGFSDITVRGEPQAVKLKVLLDDKPLNAADVTPNYVTSQPNGPGCEPTCRNATSEIAIPCGEIADGPSLRRARPVSLANDRGAIRRRTCCRPCAG
jgi:hypothetical protein